MRFTLECAEYQNANPRPAHLQTEVKTPSQADVKKWAPTRKQRSRPEFNEPTSRTRDRKIVPNYRMCPEHRHRNWNQQQHRIGPGPQIQTGLGRIDRNAVQRIDTDSVDHDQAGQ
jgi:hypothetical protein